MSMLINAHRFGVAVPCDSQFANTKMLLLAQGSNGGTTFTDDSSIGATMTRIGGATTSTAQARFGASSISLGGSDGLSASGLSGSAFVSNDFCIEISVYPSAHADWQCLFERRNGSEAAGLAIYRNPSGLIEVNTGDSNATSWNLVQTSGAAISNGAWSDIVYARDSSGISLWVNGSRKANTTIGFAIESTIAAPPITVGIAQNGSSYGFHGYIGALRYTLGNSRFATGDTTIATPAAIYPTVAC